jgi:hypothetical protein
MEDGRVGRPVAARRASADNLREEIRQADSEQERVQRDPEDREQEDRAVEDGLRTQGRQRRERDGEQEQHDDAAEEHRDCPRKRGAQRLVDRPARPP